MNARKPSAERQEAKAVPVMSKARRTLTDQEVNTILCALRGMYADAYGANGIRRCSPLACDHFEDAPPLTTDEAMELCEQIGLDGVDVTYDETKGEV